MAAALIVLGGIWFKMRRRNKTVEERGPVIPYGATSKPGYLSEVEGSNAHNELPAFVGHEMGAEQSNEKKHPVHELQ